jgi:large subunit ribosomal protein L25
MAKIELSAGLRVVAGKGAARKVRNDRKIPAVIYGNKIEPAAIELNGHDFAELVKKPGLRTKLFVIDTGKTKENAMLMDIQYHPVKDVPIHADFKRIDVSKPVYVDVPLNLMNVETSRGLKMGGALNFAVRSVLISAKVADIPEKIDIDIQNMNITDTIHGRDLTLPRNVELGLRQADLAFVTITGKMKEEPAEAASAAAAAAAPAGDAKKTPEPAKQPDAKEAKK